MKTYTFHAMTSCYSGPMLSLDELTKLFEQRAMVSCSHWGMYDVPTYSVEDVDAGDDYYA